MRYLRMMVGSLGHGLGRGDGRLAAVRERTPAIKRRDLRYVLYEVSRPTKENWWRLHGEGRAGARCPSTRYAHGGNRRPCSCAVEAEPARFGGNDGR